MAFADLDGIRIHYELEGDAVRPVLVLSNSLGSNLAMWQPQFVDLASHFRILRYDPRGHGESSEPVGPYTIADLGCDVLGLLDQLSIEKASFCGISMGGVTGQWLAVNAPHRLEKLVLANTAAKIGTAETWDARIAIVQQDGLRTIIPGTLERWFTTGFRTAHPETVAAIEAMLWAANPRGYASCCAAIRDADFRMKLQQIVTQTLIVSSTKDQVTPPEVGKFLAAGIAGARYLELPAAHLSSVEAAEGFNAALLGFLAG